MNRRQSTSLRAAALGRNFVEERYLIKTVQLTYYVDKRIFQTAANYFLLSSRKVAATTYIL